LRKIIIISVFMIVANVIPIGCANKDPENLQNQSKSTYSIPEWVKSVKKTSGMVCAVGISELTYYKDDARKYAAESARRELARTLSVQVKSIMVDTSSQDGSNIDQANIMKISSWTSKVVLTNSFIKEYWVDKKGIVSGGKKDITYALACVPFPLPDQVNINNSNESDNVSP